MTQIVLDLRTEVANKFNNLLQLFDTNELLFEKFIEYHTKKLKREIIAMQEDLDKYEKLYNKKSVDFYLEFESGKLGDNEDYMIWAGIYEMQLNCKQKLQKLL